MAHEIIAEPGTKIDAFVMAVGGGGCISGNSEILKEKISNLQIIGVEPFYLWNISGVM
jgi:cysteine synthase A